MPFVLLAFNPAFADSDEFEFFLLSFCKNFFLLASFSAFRAFYVSRPPYMHGKICLPICRHVSMIATLAFIPFQSVSLPLRSASTTAFTVSSMLRPSSDTVISAHFWYNTVLSL